MAERVGRYMTAAELAPKPGAKTRRWEILPVSAAAGPCLGIVQWYGAWRQYVFQPAPLTEYSAGCLRDLAAFLDAKNKEQRNGRA